MAEKSAIEIKVNELEQWFKENPNLPQEIDRLLVRRFLKCMGYDVEETKKLIELNYSMRNTHTHVFIDRDPEDEHIKKSREVVDFLLLPGLTPEGNKLQIYRIADDDPKNFNPLHDTKIFFMIADCRFILPDVEISEDLENNDGHLADGDIQIVDVGSYTLGHAARISIPLFRVYNKFLQEAYPIRMRAIHVINCPPFLNKITAILKPFIRDDVYKMIHFHTDGIDSLYEYVPRDMLPNEYGGKAGTVADLKLKGTQVLNEYRNYLMDSKKWKAEIPTPARRSWFGW